MQLIEESRQRQIVPDTALDVFLDLFHCVSEQISDVYGGANSGCGNRKVLHGCDDAERFEASV